MIKDTINKIFETTFDFPIWKLEVDSNTNNLAIETRNPQDTFPSFSIYSFDGNIIWEEYRPNEKEWTIEAIQGDYLILKKLGTSSPLQAGIQILHIPTKTLLTTFNEYVLKEVKKNTIVARHRSIPSGLYFYIDLKTTKVNNLNTENIDDYERNIELPQIYQGKLPTFMQEISYENHIWIQRNSDHFIWTYHQQTGEGLNLNIIISSKHEIVTKKTIISGLQRLILQPYFKVNNYIFFLTDTKQKIVTYLV